MSIATVLASGCASPPKPLEPAAVYAPSDADQVNSPARLPPPQSNDSHVSPIRPASHVAPAASDSQDSLFGPDASLDKRLEQRFRKLLDSLSQASTASIPAACDDRAEMVAAYRFFDNDKVQFENVLEPHLESSYLRVAKQRVALLLQDTIAPADRSTRLRTSRAFLRVEESSNARPTRFARRHCCCAQSVLMVDHFDQYRISVGELTAERKQRKQN